MKCSLLYFCLFVGVRLGTKVPVYGEVVECDVMTDLKIASRIRTWPTIVETVNYIVAFWQMFVICLLYDSD